MDFLIDFQTMELSCIVSKEKLTKCVQVVRINITGFEIITKYFIAHFQMPTEMRSTMNVVFVLSKFAWSDNPQIGWEFYLFIFFRIFL